MNKTNARTTSFVASAILLVCLVQGAAVNSAEAESGDFTTTVPIEVPPFHGLEPNLNLRYSSHGTTGWLGIGWGMGAPSTIVRASPGRGAPAYDGTDIFLLDGMELVPCPGTGPGVLSSSPSCTSALAPASTVAYSTKIETFRRIYRNDVPAGSEWYVWSRDGTKITYEPVLAPIGAVGTYRWAVAEVTDTHANSINYTYWCDGSSTGNQCYLDRIAYGGSPNAPQTIVKFYSKSFSPGSYATGINLIQTNYHLVTIDVVGRDGAGVYHRVRTYALSYDPNTVSAFLAQVQEYGTDAVINCGTVNGDPCSNDGSHHSGQILSGTSKPPITFTPLRNSTMYGSNSEPIPGFSPPAVSYASQTTSVGAPWGDGGTQFYVGDLDGDGRVDLLRIRFEYPTNVIHLGATLWRRDGSLVSKEQIVKEDPNALPQGFEGGIMADVNGDGRVDFIYGRIQQACDAVYPKPLFGSCSHWEIVTYLTQDGGEIPSTPVVQDTNWPYQDRDELLLGDINGDGMADVIVVSPFPDSVGLHTMLSLGDGHFDYLNAKNSGFDKPGYTQNVYLTGDFNGDGKDDILAAMIVPDGTDNVYMGFDAIGFDVAISDGDGAFVELGEKRSRIKWEAGGSWFVGDVDGDGRAELMGGNGVGLITFGISLGVTLDSSVNFIPKAVGDFDGDRRTDFLGQCPPSTPGMCKYMSNGDGTFSATGERLPVTSSCGGNALLNLAADLNGDRRADYLVASSPDKSRLCINIQPSPDTGIDSFHWIPTDVNGDGLGDMVYVYFMNPGFTVYTSLRNSNLSQTLVSQDASKVTAFGPADAQKALTEFNDPDPTGWRTMDVDGDGRADLVFVAWRNPGIRIYTLLSNGHGTWRGTYSDLLTDFGQSDVYQWRPMDVNGDGKMDLVHITSLGYGMARVDTLLSSGDGTWTAVTQQFNNYLYMADVFHWKAMDVNGDGKADLVYVRGVMPGSVGGVEVYVLLSLGDGHWKLVFNDLPPRLGSSEPFQVPDGFNFKPAEVNGDDKTDLLYVNQKPGSSWWNVYVLLSRGDGNWDERSYLFQSTPNTFRASAWRAADVNGDGRADLIYVAPNSGIYTALNNGEGWQAPTLEAKNLAGTPAEQLGLQIWDVNGDGQADITYRTLAGVETYISSGPRDIVAATKNGEGGQTVVYYTSSSTWKNKYVPVGMAFLTMREVDSVPAPKANTLTQLTYKYSGALWNDRERRFEGYQEVDVILDALGTQTATTFQLDPRCGALPVQMALRDAKGYDYGFVKTDYAVTQQEPFVCIPSQTTHAECNLNEDNGADPSKCRLTAEDYLYDAYGNTTNVKEHCVAPVSCAERTTERKYFPNLNHYILGLPGVENIYGGDAGGISLQAQRLFVYDRNQTSSGVPDYMQPPKKGDLTELRSWDNQPPFRYVATDFLYDSTGNLTQTTNPAGKAMKASYDSSYSLFPTSNCVCTSSACTTFLYCSSVSWDLALGVVSSTTDPNQNSTSFNYDPLLRLKKIDFSDGSWLRREYLNWGDPTTQFVKTTISDDTPDGLWSETYFDGFARPYRIVKKAPDSSVERDIVYDDVTNTRVSSWHRGSENLRWTALERDGAGRIKKLTHPDSTSRAWAYGNDGSSIWAASYSEIGQERRTYSDIDRRITVRETVSPGSCSAPDSCTAAPLYSFTYYDHDPLGHLSSITDSVGNVTSLKWNSLGDKLQSCTPDLGCWTYTYYLDGQPQNRTDARNITFHYEYDAANRLAKKQYPPGPSGGQPTALWTYDEPGHGASIGRVTTINDPSGRGSGSYTYDSVGRVQSIVKEVAGIQKKLSFTYDSAGRLHTLTYPDGEIVTYTYDAGGRLASVVGNARYASDLLYDAAGRLLQIRYGNGVVTKFAYAEQREWLTDEATTLSDSSGSEVTLFQATYYRDSVGRVAAITSTTNPSMNQTFGYDALNRLTQVGGDRFAYDRVGNMTYNPAVGVYTYPAPGQPRPHAVATAGSDAFYYDSNGNMYRQVSTQGSNTGIAREVIWDADNRPTQMSVSNGTGGPSTTTFGYDASGERTSKASTAGTTYYFGDYIRQGPDGSVTKYYYADGMLVARGDASGVVYYHTDENGSPRIVSDSGGAIVHRDDYGPFGLSYGSASGITNDPGFESHQADAETGLIDMGARYYDAKLGRFISPDSVVPELLDPQSLNRYSYGRNDPLNRVDPSGNQDVGICINMDGGTCADASDTGLSGGFPTLLGFPGAGQFGPPDAGQPSGGTPQPPTSMPLGPPARAPQAGWASGQGLGPPWGGTWAASLSAGPAVGFYAASGSFAGASAILQIQNESEALALEKARQDWKNFQNRAVIQEEGARRDQIFNPLAQKVFETTMRTTLESLGPSVMAGTASRLAGYTEWVEAEEAVGGLLAEEHDLPVLLHNTEEIPNLLEFSDLQSKFRRPDFLTERVLGEVKFRAELYLSRQLVNDVAFAKLTGREFQLFVRPDTKLTGPLEEWIKVGFIRLRLIPGRY